MQDHCKTSAIPFYDEGLHITQSMIRIRRRFLYVEVIKKKTRGNIRTALVVEE